MALFRDARRAAGVATGGTIPEITLDALRILLAPPLVRNDGIARLRAHLSRSTLS